jgi:hypothetical protein
MKSDGNSIYSWLSICIQRFNNLNNIVLHYTTIYFILNSELRIIKTK